MWSVCCVLRVCVMLCGSVESVPTNVLVVEIRVTKATIGHTPGATFVSGIQGLGLKTGFFCWFLLFGLQFGPNETKRPGH